MKKSNAYFRIRFPRTSDAPDIQARLIPYDPLGFLEEDEWWEVYFHDHVWQNIEPLFRKNCERDGSVPVYTAQRLEQENWNRLWEESIQPIQVSDRICIAPSWHVVDADPNVIVLTIDPKMSFGTGYHATTRLMLRLLETHIRPDDTVLDVGTGTGVLAIAAIRLGAAHADGVDTDEWSYENAMENAERNGVADRILVAEGSLEAVSGTYDVILSNITKIDNLQMLPRLDAMLRPGGRILLSGFYRTDTADIHLALEQLRLRVDENKEEDEWAAVSAVKEAP